MSLLTRNLLVLPAVLILRAPILLIVLGLEKIVKVGYAYQSFLDGLGVHWKQKL